MSLERYIRNQLAPAGVANTQSTTQWTECQPTNPNVASQIPS